MNIQQKKLHIFSVLVYVLLIFSFYILGGGTKIEEEEVVDTFNTSLPEAYLEELSENRLDAIYRAEGLKEEQRRLESRQNNSFRWLIEEDNDSSTKVVEETIVEEEEIIPEEKTQRSYRSSRRKKSQLSEEELFELEKQAILAKKKRELEEKLGLVNNEEEVTNQVKEKNSDIVVGKKRNKGFYSVNEEDKDVKPDIRALVHGNYKNIKTGAIVKFRIIDEFTIDGTHIPKNTFLYGQLSFSSSRAMIKIENIQYKNMIIPFNASIYDQDGFEGLYTPDNIVDEAKRDVANDVISSTNLNISGGLPLITGAANAVTSAIKSATQSAVKEKKLNISSNYQVNIRYE